MLESCQSGGWMSRFWLILIVIGALKLLAQPEYSPIQLNSDIVKPDSSEINRIKILENTTTENAIEENDVEHITAKKNPWLYDNRLGCLTDGVTYLVPMIVLYSIAPGLNHEFYPLSNQCTPCFYPIGLVFIEKMYKNILTTTERKKDEFSGISCSFQRGEALPYYQWRLDYSEGELFPNIEFMSLNSININYFLSINSKLKILLNINHYNCYLNGPNFISFGAGLSINDYNIILEKVIVGFYHFGDVSAGL